MMDEAHKAGLEAAVASLVADYGQEKIAKRGPVALIDGLITSAQKEGSPESHELIAVLTANRDEAERRVAGLLGMM